MTKRQITLIPGIEDKRPQTLQEIPSLFTDKHLPGRKVVRLAMDLARKEKKIPAKSPERTIWYSFVKKSLQEDAPTNNKSEPVKNLESCFYGGLSDVIRNTDLYYEDYNIENSGIVHSIQETKGFGNTIICLEKDSYFGVFKQFAELLGVSVYCGGGQPSLSGTEYLYRNLFDKQHLNLLSITDFDPCGLDISNTFLNQLGLFAKRDGFDVKLIRVGILPKYYLTSELEQALYEVKESKRSRWNTPEMIAIRRQFNIEPNLGLEVESLPADPTPIFTTLFSQYKLNQWEGRARIRLIMFKFLLDLFGIKSFFNFTLENSFDIEHDAIDIINEVTNLESNKTTKDRIKEQYEFNSELMDQLVDPEKDNVIDELNNWKKETIENFLNDPQKCAEFTQIAINSVSTDEKNLSLKQFSPPEEIKEKITIDPERQTIIAENNAFFEKIYGEIKTYNIELREKLSKLQGGH